MPDYREQELREERIEPGTASESMKKEVHSSHVFFKYLGKNCLIAVGPVTKTFYRFDSPGAIVAVDRRDQPSLLVIPQLQEVIASQAFADDDVPETELP